MRSTRASAAISRLNARDSVHEYSMALTNDSRFTLLRSSEKGISEALNAPLALDEFVLFVNATGPQTPIRISKNDVKFEQQLIRKNSLEKSSS